MGLSLRSMATSLRMLGWTFLLPPGCLLHLNQASPLSDGSLGGYWPVVLECKYPIDIICSCLLTLRLIERGSCESSLLG